jgi:hypothetical protein
MKLIISVALITAMMVGCSTPATKEVNVHDQTIGSVTIKYNSSGDWIQVQAKGMAAVPNSTPHAIAQSAKIAAMHAKQNVADFMNNKFTSDKVADITSTSTVSNKVNDMETVMIVTERMRDTSTAVLRGLQVTNQTNDSNFVTVELTATKQSIEAASALKNSMGN